MQPSEATLPQGEAEGTEQPQLTHGDEFMVLVFGFALGMIVGGVFLVYVVLSAANLLT